MWHAYKGTGTPRCGFGLRQSDLLHLSSHTAGLGADEPWALTSATFLLFKVEEHILQLSLNAQPWPFPGWVPTTLQGCRHPESSDSASCVHRWITGHSAQHLAAKKFSVRLCRMGEFSHLMSVIILLFPNLPPVPPPAPGSGKEGLSCLVLGS